MNFNDVKELCKEEATKKWNYIKEHKVQFGVAGAGVIGFAMLLLSKRKGDVIDDEELCDVTFHKLWNANDFEKDVDEQIFTDLAPKIEDFVLDNHFKHCKLEREYKLGEGVYKAVKITIDQIEND